MFVLLIQYLILAGYICEEKVSTSSYGHCITYVSNTSNSKVIFVFVLPSSQSNLSNGDFIINKLPVVAKPFWSLESFLFNRKLSCTQRTFHLQSVGLSSILLRFLWAPLSALLAIETKSFTSSVTVDFSSV